MFFIIFVFDGKAFLILFSSDCGIYAFSSLEQFKKAYGSIVFTDEGISIWVSEEHPEKASFSINKRLEHFEKSTFCNFEHLENAQFLIDWHDSGILISVKFWHK